MTSQIVEEQILTINKLPKSFIYKDKSVGTFGGEGHYIRQEELEAWIRSFASTLIEKERARLKSIFDTALKSANDGDDVVNAMSEALAPSTKLQEMK